MNSFDVNEPPTNEIKALPISKVIQITAKGIRIRIWRSLIVISSIVLAIAFLSYILTSDGIIQSAIKVNTQPIMQMLQKAEIRTDNLENQRIQTYWMVGLALLISFVGIINAMLMSVTERFREIGTMKCLGALDSFVMNSFLIESMFEGGVGATVGVVLGLTLAYFEAFLIFGNEVWALMSIGSVFTIIGISFASGVVITVLGALYPALQAAKMTPVVALRSEM